MIWELTVTSVAGFSKMEPATWNSTLYEHLSCSGKLWLLQSLLGHCDFPTCHRLF